MSQRSYNTGMASAYFALMKGGGEHYTLYLSNALDRLGHHVSIICGKQPLSEPHPLSETHSIKYVPQLFFLRDLGAKKIPYLSGLGSLLHNMQYQHYLERHLNKYHDYDIIHTHDPSSLYMAVRIKQRYGIPVVASFHGPPNQKMIAEVKKVDAVLPVNDSICQIFQEHGVNNVYCIPCAVDRTKFKKMETDKTANGHIILYVGRLMPIKNIENLIRAFQIVSTNDPSANLMIVGEGPSKKHLISLTERLDLTKKVLFAGAVPNENLPRIYNMADAFVLPSLYEAFSLVALEAAACGVPIVISEEAKAMIQTLGDDVVFPVNPLDPKQISDGILSALNLGKNNKITDLAAKRIGKLDWDRNARIVTNIYDLVINS